MKFISLEFLKFELVKLLDFYEEFDVLFQLDSKIIDEVVLVFFDYFFVMFLQLDYIEILFLVF